MSIVVTETLPTSLQCLIDLIQKNQEQMTPGLAQRLVVDAQVQPSDLEAWADYDHPLADSYGRKLVFEDDFFEVMVMSWEIGDVSAIHDHGYTQWGAVQVFGPAEHGLFLVEDQHLTTLARDQVVPGRVLAVGNRLVHQMANKSDERFLSLHVYGVSKGKGLEAPSVTADARIWNLSEGVIEHTSGGVFFALPTEQVSDVIEGPSCDYVSWLHDTVECLRRVRLARTQNDTPELADKEERLTHALFDACRWDAFASELKEILDNADHTTDSKHWGIIRSTLQNAANLQAELFRADSDASDAFATYAELYDEVIGKQCLESFTSHYLQFVVNEFQLNLAELKTLSVGCGTGIMEHHILTQFAVPRENVLGIDVSSAMVEVAARKINAQQQDILANPATWNNDAAAWDIALASLNVLQYLPAGTMEQAIANIAAITNSGGWFVGDFITPDHVRWYPNVIQSDKVISLRQPELIERDHNTLQCSSILNVSRQQGKLRITDEGTHSRTLPSLMKVRGLFQKHYATIHVFDAVTLEALADDADTCPSTRYLIVARKR